MCVATPKFAVGVDCCTYRSAAGPNWYSGVLRSTVHVRLAGVASVRAPLSARTSNWCCPAVRPETTFGEVHGENEPVSTRHSKVAPVSLAENVKLVVLTLETPDGPASIAVSGGAFVPGRRLCR